MHLNTYSHINILESIDSTNNHAIKQLHGGMAGHGMAWFAKAQTAGKGQMGKNWQSAPGQNIMMSIALHPPAASAQYPFLLSALIALTVRHFFAGYASATNTTIKWPNDLYFNSKKAGGILIENIYAGNNWKWAVLGIGININQTVFDATIPNATSLKQITGKEYDVVELGIKLYNEIMQQLAVASSKEIMNEFNRHLFKKDEKVKLKKDTAVFETTIKKVNERGELITEDVIERCFNVGDVEWLL